MVTARMGSKRIHKFLANFPEAIDTICRGVAFRLAYHGIHDRRAPIARSHWHEFRRISDGVRMGRSLDESMWEVAGRLDTPEYRFFIIALAIQRETGGNLAETLGNLADLLRKRRQMRLKNSAPCLPRRGQAP